MKQNKPIGFYFGHKPDIRTHKEEEGLPLPYKRIGIEIEAENIPYVFEDMSHSLYYWDVTNDGSLRNYGAEFISRKVQGKDIAAALEEINNFFSKNEIAPAYTDRTSVHIHIDCRYLLFNQLKVLIFLYLLYEPLLFEYVGKEREHNPYCIPYYLNLRGIGNLSNLFNATQVESKLTIGVVSNSHRYEAMNLRSLSEHGSIEFRHHYGTHNKEKIYEWVKLLFTMYKQAKEMDHENLLERFKNLPYEELIEDFNNLTKVKDLSESAFKADYSASTLLQYSASRRNKY